MSKPLDNDCVDMIVKYIRKLEAENARLKAERDLLDKKEALQYRLRDEFEAECKRLKAEVERLTKAALHVHQELDEFGQVSAKSVHELRDAAKGGQP
jgi:molecular chaperone GrpE (heat shock protein)